MEKKNRGFKGLVITLAVILFSVISLIIKVLINSTPTEDLPSFTPIIIGVIFVACIGYSIYAIFFSKDSFYGKKRIEKKAQKTEEKTLREMFEEKEKKGVAYKNRRTNWVLITIVILISLSLVGGAFYWFEYRPTQIKKQCSFVIVNIPAVSEVTEQEAEESIAANNACKAKINIKVKDSELGLMDTSAIEKWGEEEKCNQEYPIKIQTTAREARQEVREASTSEYQSCLRSNGL